MCWEVVKGCWAVMWEEVERWWRVVVRGGIGAGFGFGWCRDLSVPGEFL